ncbi:DUF3396 domain-containing protein [Paucibacter sp. R3-3]|uniref:DUF3396 domain-containing protein n=1 Tax=Roseateles agri TaxID=3098619 RepID=A0ABU5DAK2_9BURK|nr:type VI immunity family protein [Paucibacter sp. R3-3]MDY0743290.1 DUF3396 domain-containing protein [Paucibacter sp. R3-3]
MNAAAPRNPILYPSTDPLDPGLLLEMKLRLVLYLESPPDPVALVGLYRTYMHRFGSRITAYRSTAFGDLPSQWSESARIEFEASLLPDLYRGTAWGYVFGEEAPADARLFLFHGARPASEYGRASLLRFDFEWHVDVRQVLELAVTTLQAFDCMCGSLGYVLAPGDARAATSDHGLGFAAAMRYWGVQAQDLDATADVAQQGIPSIAWVTILGPRLLERRPDAVAAARAMAFASYDVGAQLMLMTEQRPRLIDRNRRETLGNYPAVAQALSPLQIEGHGTFAEEPWDEDCTERYLRRFTAARPP